MKWAAGLVILGSLVASPWTSAHADTGEFALGTKIGLGSSAGFGDSGLTISTDLDIRLGLLDWLHLDADAGAMIKEESLAPKAGLSLTAAFDVFRWVPELSLGSTLIFGSSNGIVVTPTAGIGLRYHLDLSWSLAGGIEGGWTSDAHLWLGTLSVLYTLNAF